MPPTIELIARGLLVLNNHILLCRNRAKGYCYLPGGHIEFGESAPAALARELLEETGQKVIVGNLLNVAEFTFKTNKRPHHELNLTFHMELAPPATRRTGSAPRSKSGAKSGTRESARPPAGSAVARAAERVAKVNSGASDLPEITSREDWIEFVWAPAGDLAKPGRFDIRPQPTRDWLATKPWRALFLPGKRDAGGAGGAEASPWWQAMVQQ